MKKIISIIGLIFACNLVVAQQDSQFSHDMYNQMAYNPGFAGSIGQMCATIIRRQQWQGGIEGVPTTTMFSLHGAFKFYGQEKSGIGLVIQQDELGFNKDFAAKTSFSHRKAIWKGYLGLGLELGIVNKALEADWKFPEGNEPDLASKDAVTAFDMGMGAYYQTNNMYVGFSVSHLNQARLKLESEKGGIADVNPYLKRHYFLTAGYMMQTPIALLEFMPSSLIKSDGAATQFSINATFLYNKRFWGGVTYRNLDAIVAMAGIELQNGIKFGYAYDITTTRIGYGSHEILLSYTFDILKESGTPQRYKSVRFL